MRVFWTEQLEDRRREGHREGDLFSYLLDARFDDEPLDDDVLLDMCTVLTLAGLDTTRAELGVHVPSPGPASGAPPER